MITNNKMLLLDYFAEVELTEDYEPYFCSVEDAITIVIIGTFCGFKNLKQIHQWARHEKIQELLSSHFGVSYVPCYYWLTRLLKIIDPNSMNECFIKWVLSLLPSNMEGKTVSIDGKTICSTAKMKKFESALHIVSAQISELGLTFGQKATEGKSNEIPAAQSLIKMLKLKGCIVVADALNCQKETAKVIIKQKGDYLLSVKDNQPNLKKEIADYVGDKVLRQSMDKAKTTEKNRGRREKREAFVCPEIDWLFGKEQWEKISCIGAIHTNFTTSKGVSDEWHYYISSLPLTANQLLKHARAEWNVESMHWLLDVHFGEDDCRVQDENVQKILNMIRKSVLNLIRTYKTKNNSKKPFSNIMLDCLIDPLHILEICQKNEN